MTQSLNQQMADAVSAFAAANDNLETARCYLSDARRQETDAIDRVNETQKKLDELIAVLKKEAPRDTDWSNRKLVREVLTP